MVSAMSRSGSRTMSNPANSRLRMLPRPDGKWNVQPPPSDRRDSSQVARGGAPRRSSTPPRSSGAAPAPCRPSARRPIRRGPVSSASGRRGAVRPPGRRIRSWPRVCFAPPGSNCGSHPGNLPGNLEHGRRRFKIIHPCHPTRKQPQLMAAVKRRPLEVASRRVVQDAKLAIRDVYDAIVELVHSTRRSSGNSPSSAGSRCGRKRFPRSAKEIR